MKRKVVFNRGQISFCILFESIRVVTKKGTYELIMDLILGDDHYYKASTTLVVVLLPS